MRSAIASDWRGPSLVIDGSENAMLNLGLLCISTSK